MTGSASVSVAQSSLSRGSSISSHNSHSHSHSRNGSRGSVTGTIATGMTTAYTTAVASKSAAAAAGVAVADATGTAVLRQGDTEYRAVHQIKLSALTHNYHCVEAAASHQRCNVIVVVKADGYGHGAIDTAIHLADSVGADAFAVATLEEGIVLRKALDATAAQSQQNKRKPMAVARAATVAATAIPTATDVNSSSTVQQHQQALLPGMKPPKKMPFADLSTMFQPPTSNSSDTATTASITTTDTTPTLATNATATATATTTTTFLSRRSTVIRILVLGPPVGYPRCFDDYYFWGIECMVSGPEVANALMEWINNPMDRQTRVVERVALETKLKHLDPEYDALAASSAAANGGNAEHTDINGGPGGVSNAATAAMKSATLSGMAGTDLAKEFRQLLQQHQKAKVIPAIIGRNMSSTVSSERSSRAPSPNSINNINNNGMNGPATNGTTKSGASTNNHNAPPPPPPPQPVAAISFGGIEAAALSSRNREKVMTHNPVWVEDSSDELELADAATSNTPIDSEQQINSGKGTNPMNTTSLTNNGASTPTTTTPTAANHKKSNTSIMNVNGMNNNNTNNRRRLRWHALVDSGMGRLGFKTDYPQHGERRDTVEILQELVKAEHSHNAPVEFFGMCTHMADANATSTYTHDQIIRFKSLLKRVRDVGISVPTVSTDNSAALLTTTLTHFSPDDLLTQPGLNTRGYVRIGGAIYGQRPAFTQLQPVSTLIAAVRHVAILKEGDSVGYDRAYIAPHNVRIATLTIGFADGYPRDLGNGRGHVAIRNKLYPVAGNVCMDMMMVELGHASEACDVKVGDVAVLWGGDNGVTLKDLAGALKTTQSALTCGLNKTRVAREYV